MNRLRTVARILPLRRNFHSCQHDTSMAAIRKALHHAPISPVQQQVASLSTTVGALGGRMRWVRCWRGAGPKADSATVQPTNMDITKEISPLQTYVLENERHAFIVLDKGRALHVSREVFLDITANAAALDLEDAYRAYTIKPVSYEELKFLEPGSDTLTRRFQCLDVIYHIRRNIGRDEKGGERIELTQLPKVLESKDGVTEKVAPPDLMTLAGVDKHVVVRELRNKMEVARHVFVLAKSEEIDNY